MKGGILSRSRARLMERKGKTPNGPPCVIVARRPALALTWLAYANEPEKPQFCHEKIQKAQNMAMNCSHPVIHPLDHGAYRASSLNLSVLSVAFVVIAFSMMKFLFSKYEFHSRLIA